MHMMERRRCEWKMTVEHLVVRREVSENQVVMGVGLLYYVRTGGENGWVDGATLVFQSKKATGNYHNEMTAQYFEEWFHDALMPNIQPNSLIVMDNAPYHSRRLEPVPTMSSRKQMIQDWLSNHGISFLDCARENCIEHVTLSLIMLWLYCLDLGL